jgi:hypothetical protein
MALTDAEIATVAEIIQELHHSAQVIVDYNDLTAAQETVLRGDLTLWNTLRDKHTKLKGGKDGVDYNPARSRAAIKERVLVMLGLPSYPGVVRKVRA